MALSKLWQHKIKVIDDFFPLISFRNDGHAFLVKKYLLKKISLLNPISRDEVEISLNDFQKNYSDFFIIVKRLNDREQEERSGHWFFSAFRKANGSTPR